MVVISVSLNGHSHDWYQQGLDHIFPWVIHHHSNYVVAVSFGVHIALYDRQTETREQAVIFQRVHHKIRISR